MDGVLMTAAEAEPMSLFVLVIALLVPVLLLAVLGRRFMRSGKQRRQATEKMRELERELEQMRIDAEAKRAEQRSQQGK